MSARIVSRRCYACQELGGWRPQEGFKFSSAEEADRENQQERRQTSVDRGGQVVFVSDSPEGREEKGQKRMLHEVLLALLGHTGDFVIEQGDESGELVFKHASCLAFVQPSERKLVEFVAKSRKPKRGMVHQRE